MNIDDVKDVEIPKGCLIQEIFNRQHELAVKYAPIERKNGFYYPELHSPPHIDDGIFQTWIKGMLWRTTEEIAEAFEHLPSLVKWKDRWDEDHQVRHFFEELADALHFLVEVSIFNALPVASVRDAWEAIEEDTNMKLDVGYKQRISQDSIQLLGFQVVVALGLTGNTLKNKPWKTTQMTTDRLKFSMMLLQAWRQFIFLWCYLGCTREDVYTLYMKKNAVNVFRQKTNY